MDNWTKLKTRASLVPQLVKKPSAIQETPVHFLGREDPLEKGGATHWRREELPTRLFLGFPAGSAGKESTCMWETWIQFLGWENPLEKGKATHSSIPAWRIPWTL